jgi:hypothetical protein
LLQSKVVYLHQIKGYERFYYRIRGSKQRDANALATLFSVYAQSDLAGECICFGYNDWTGYYYIAFENISLQIVLTYRGDVMFMTTDFETGEEEYFDTEEEAMEHLATVE